MEEPERFRVEITPFRVDSYKNLLMFGYPVIGGWIPKLAFETEVSYSLHEDTLEPIKKRYYKFFVAEWFIRGYVFVYKVEEVDMFGGGDG